MTASKFFPEDAPERLALDFFSRVWGPTHELDAIEDLMTEDFAITTAGRQIQGRTAFKKWVAEFQPRLLDAENETVELFASAAGNRVVQRWISPG